MFLFLESEIRSTKHIDKSCPNSFLICFLTLILHIFSRSISYIELLSPYYSVDLYLLLNVL